MKQKITGGSVPDGNDGARTPGGDGLARVLGGTDAAALAVGIVVGTGIFAVPGFVAQELGSPDAILVVWLLGGAIALCGALTYAEVGSMFPQQGGGFLFVLEAFGPFAAFFKGWGSFLIGYPASSAGIATILGTYVARGAGLGDGVIRPIAIGAALLVCLLNLRGTRFSASLQTALTLVKVGAIGVLALVILAITSGEGVARLATERSAPWPAWSAFAAALVGVLWTYDGWENLTVVGGEIARPEKRIVRGLLGTIGVVTALYLLANAGYLVALPLEALAGSDAPAAAAAEAALGPAGGKILAVLVAVSAFGALFGIGIAGPRYTWSMARHGLFFQAAGQLDPETAAPRWGAVALFLVTTIYVVSGTFQQILGYYVAVSLIYNVLTILCVFRLRAKMPDRKRPFRVPGYPVVPALFVAAALWITAGEIAERPIRTGMGLLVLFSSFPAYVIWRRRVGR